MTSCQTELFNRYYARAKKQATGVVAKLRAKGVAIDPDDLESDVGLFLLTAIKRYQDRETEAAFFNEALWAWAKGRYADEIRAFKSPIRAQQLASDFDRAAPEGPKDPFELGRSCPYPEVASRLLSGEPVMSVAESVGRRQWQTVIKPALTNYFQSEGVLS